MAKLCQEPAVDEDNEEDAVGAFLDDLFYMFINMNIYWHALFAGIIIGICAMSLGGAISVLVSPYPTFEEYFIGNLTLGVMTLILGVGYGLWSREKSEEVKKH